MEEMEKEAKEITRQVNQQRPSSRKPRPNAKESDFLGRILPNTIHVLGGGTYGNFEMVLGYVPHAS